MTRRRARLFIGLLTLCLLSSYGGATLSAEQVAARIRNRMLRIWTPQNLRVIVTPYPNNEGIEKGAFQQIKITADSLTSKGIRMTNVLFQINDVVIDLPALTLHNKVQLLRRGSQKIHGEFSEADLNRALPLRKHHIENLRVRLDYGKVIFTGKYRFGFSTNLMMEGRVEIPDGYRLNFVPTKATVGGIPLPTGPLQTLLGRINPLIDFRKVPLSPRIKRLILRPGHLTVEG